MKRFLLLLLGFFIVLTNLNAKTFYYHQWFFGNQAMVSFLDPSGDPKKTDYSAMYSKEGSTSICDADGNLYFYSNGETVWNFKHQIMDEGDNLMGDNSAPQAAFAVPFPGDDSRFYLFTMGAAENSKNGLRYNLIDMAENEGDGKVIEKNVEVRQNMSEAMTITLYNGGDELCEGKGYWLFANPSDDNSIFLYRVDSTGVNLERTVSISSSIKMFQIRVSHDREKVVLAHQQGVEVYSFNDVTGAMSLQDSYSIPLAYSAEFSPDNEMLYVASYDAGEIHQIDLSDGSIHVFNPDDISRIMALQKGPDDRIYVGYAGQKFLGRINNPNMEGDFAGYVPNTINIDPYSAQWGLTQVIPDMPECDNRVFRKIYALEDELCEGDILVLYARKDERASYKWTAPNGDIFSGSSVRTIAKKEYDGIFTLEVTFPDGEKIILQTTVSVIPGPEFTITGDTTLCGVDDKVRITAKASRKLDTLYWNVDFVAIDSTTAFIFPTEPGEYIVYGRNKAGCEDSAIVNIVRYDPVDPEIQGETVLCYNEETTLEAFPQGDEGEYEYEWSTGETGTSITVSDSSEYWVRVYQVGGCWDTAWVNVEYYEYYEPEYNVESPFTLCDGDVIDVVITNYNADYDYEWENGSRLSTRKISDAGEYILKIETPEGCIYYDTLNVFTRESPIAKIIQGNEIVSCGGTPVELEAMEVETDYYTWSTGETTRKITVNQDGNYWVAVGFNGTTCVDTAWIDVSFDDNLSVNIDGEAKLCGDNTTILSTNYTGDFFKYEWSTGETTPTIIVSDAGTYSVRVYTDSGCEDTSEFIVEKFEQPEISMNYEGVIEICDGERLDLIPENVNENFNNYWTDGFEGIERTVMNSGTYVFISENDVCTDTVRLQLIVNPVPGISIEADGTSLCTNPEITLRAVPYNPEHTYTWSTGQNQQSIKITEAGTYSVTVETTKGCSNYSEITIDEAGDIDFDILPGNQIEICDGESITLTVDRDFTEYLWSTGETTKTITVDTEGIYSVTVYDDQGCSATKQVEVNVNQSQLSINLDNVDFGEICIGETSVRSLVITNTNENQITIDRVELNLDVQEFFTDSYSISETLGEIVQPSEQLDIPLLFAPKVPADWTGKIRIYISDPCPAMYEVDATGISMHYTSTDLPELRLDAGEENVEMALSIEQNCTLDGSNPFSSDYRAVIKFDGTYYSSDDFTVEGDIISFDNDGLNVFVTIEGNYTFTPGNNAIFTLIGQALTGNDENSPVTLEEFQWNVTNIINEASPGSLYINEFCLQDMSKFKFFEPTMLSIAPNPAGDNVEASIVTEEAGEFSLMIVNSIGDVVKEFKFNNSKLLEREFNIQVDDLSSGVYNVILKAPWTTHAEPLIIAK